MSALITADFDASGMPLFDPIGASFRVDSYSWDVVGGPHTAQITMTGPEQTLWSASNMLRWHVTLRNQRLDRRWWGFIVGVEVTVGSVKWSVSLDSVANRIKVLFTLSTTTGDTTTTSQSQTDWADDIDSMGVFGVRELRFSMQEATAAAANAQRDELLRYGKNPIGYSEDNTDGNNAPQARLLCRGHWDSLDGRYAAAVADNATEPVTTKLSTIITTYGQQLTGVDVLDASTIETTKNISGENRAKAEAETLLKIGTLSSARLMALVQPDRRVQIVAEPTSGDYSTGRDRQLYDGNGIRLEPDSCPVGIWRRLNNTIPTAAINPRIVTIGREFIEHSEYNARTGKLTTKARGVPSVWDIGTI